jgi:4-diphosphocytidyl-2-C-methyl-D-erythritol kinase
MSGSGATCFGLCRDEQSARQLRARLVDSRPEWWCVVARLGSPGRKPPKIFPKPR